MRFIVMATYSPNMTFCLIDVSFYIITAGKNCSIYFPFKEVKSKLYTGNIWTNKSIFGEYTFQTFICTAIFVVELTFNWFGSRLFCLVVQHKLINIAQCFSK